MAAAAAAAAAVAKPSPMYTQAERTSILPFFFHFVRLLNELLTAARLHWSHCAPCARVCVRADVTRFDNR